MSICAVCQAIPSAAKKPVGAAKGKAAAPKGKAGAAKKGSPAAKKGPAWSPEQVAAGTKIQARMRGYLARKHYRWDWLAPLGATHASVGVMR